MLGIFLKQPNLIVDGAEVTIYSDFSPIYLRKSKFFTFLMTALRQINIRFTFKLIIDYGSRRVIIKAVDEVEVFLHQLQSNQLLQNPQWGWLIKSYF